MRSGLDALTPGLLAEVPGGGVDLAAPDALILDEAPDVLAGVAGLLDKGLLLNACAGGVVEGGGKR